MLLASCSAPAVTPTTEVLTETVPTQTAPAPTKTATALPTAAATAVPHHVDLDPQAIEGMTVRVWHAQRNETKALLEKLVQQFNQENDYGLTVSLHHELSDTIMNDVLLSPPAKDDFPHLVIADSAWIKAWQTAGYLMTLLQPYIDHPETGLKVQGVPEVMPQMLAQEQFNGNLTALPLWHHPHLLYYNNAFGQTLGYANPPANLTDFTKQACDALASVNQDSDPDNDGTGGWIVTNQAGALMSWLMAFDPGKSDYSNFPADSDRDLFINTLNWLRDLYDQGCIWQSRLPEPYYYFTSHNALFYSGTLSEIPIQEQSFNSSATNALDDWQLIPYPASSAETDPDPWVFSTGVSAGIFTDTAEEQFAAWVFLSWLMQPENLAALSLSAQAWPVQDTEEIDHFYRENASAELIKTLPYRKFIHPSSLPADWMSDELVLSDGFGYAFSQGAKKEDITLVWEQILETINEIQQIR